MSGSGRRDGEIVRLRPVSYSTPHGARLRLTTLDNMVAALRELRELNTAPCRGPRTETSLWEPGFKTTCNHAVTVPQSHFTTTLTASVWVIPLPTAVIVTV